jgi:arylsulfatase
MGARENTLVIYMVGDNGASAEGGLEGSTNALRAFNGIPDDLVSNLAAIDGLGGPMYANHFPAGWAWAMNTPFQWTKQVASHFGGTRNPLVISWPKKIKPDNTPRSQFYHVNDIAPTLYEVLGIKVPKRVNGYEQDPIDGVSMLTSFHDSKAPDNKHVQYFDNNGSDGIYKDGWYACTFGPLTPWLNAQKGLAEWDSSKDDWELYDLTKDFSQKNDLAKVHPEKLQEMKTLFLAQAKENKVFPIGAGIWLRLHPEDRIKSPYTSWSFDDTTRRMPEFTAPAVGNNNNTVTIELECGENASGVLYALGGAGGGLTCYMDNGHLVFEYNLMIIDHSIAKSQEKIAPGKHTVVVDTNLKVPRPGAPADIVLSVDGKEIARTSPNMTVPAAFTASESFDVGVDLGSPVSRDYFERRPYPFEGKITKVDVKLKTEPK